MLERIVCYLEGLKIDASAGSRSAELVLVLLLVVGPWIYGILMILSAPLRMLNP